MRYGIFLEKMVNRLIPVYLRGDLNTSWLLALLTPLEELNNDFLNFTRSRRRIALTTSQVMVFEEFLTDAFKDQFAVSSGRIYVTSGVSLGTPIHIEADISYPENEELWIFADEADEANFIADISTTLNYGEIDNYADVVWVNGSVIKNAVFFTLADNVLNTQYSFTVTASTLKSGVDPTQFTNQLKAAVNKYRLAGKTFNIIIQ